MRHKKHKIKNHQVSLNLESIYVHEEREEGVFWVRAMQRIMLNDRVIKLDHWQGGEIAVIFMII